MRFLTPVRLVRTFGLVLIVVGTAAVVWGVVVWRWQDPFTALYTRYEQHKLSAAYARRVSRFVPQPVRHSAVVSVAAEQRAMRRAARVYRLGSPAGEPLGRITVPRLGLRMIFVDGTDHSSLERGPGLDRRTYLPGEGRLVYIAGHRTTYLAPFSHIDALRRGDTITLQLPYGTFVYAVTRHVVVPSDDLAVLRPGATEVLALQACHPRFFASHRYIVYARPVRVVPARAVGPPYEP